MDEYIDVLNRKKFNFTKENIDALINVIEENGAYIIPRELTQKELIGLNDKEGDEFLRKCHFHHFSRLVLTWPKCNQF